MLYPYALQIAAGFTFTGTSGHLFGYPTPGHLALLFLPPLLIAGVAMVTATTPRRSRALLSSDPDTPRPT
jgi:hypothetical protein